MWSPGLLELRRKSPFSTLWIRRANGGKTGGRWRDLTLTRVVWTMHLFLILDSQAQTIERKGVARSAQVGSEEQRPPLSQIYYLR